MKTYENYKDSGIQWIGEIPVHWEIRPISRSFELIGSGTTPKSDNEIYYFEGVHNWLLTGDLNDGFIFETSKKITDEAISEHSTLKKYPVNSIVMAMYGATIGKLGILKVDTTVNQACCVLANSNVFDYRIPFYFLLVIRQEIINLSFGGGQPNISQEIVKRIKIPVPSIEEQTAIANYLDNKITEIDQVVADKEALVSLYEEEKKALINEAVTKGLNIEVKLKPCGVEWLSEIPEHWAVKRLKYLSEIKTGDKNTEDNEEDREYPFFVRSQTIERISTYSFDGEAILTAGDGVGVAKVFHYINGKFDYHQRVYRISHFKEIIGKFLFHYLENNLYKEVLKINAKSTVDSLRLPMFQNFMVTIPPLEEQTSIVQYIESETANINDKINQIKQEIDLLKEYRQALIFEAVTGKVRVFEG
jgi:type I restriction enzyme S subunit